MNTAGLLNFTIMGTTRGGGRRTAKRKGGGGGRRTATRKGGRR